MYITKNTFMKENIGKLTTPSGEGANIEVYEDGTYKLDGTINEDLVFSHGRFKNKVSSSSGLKEFQMLTGETYNDGAWFSLRTQDEINGNHIGSFNLGVRNIYTGESIAFKGYPNTSLRWGNWDIECTLCYRNSSGIYKLYKNGYKEQYGSFNITEIPASSSVSFAITLPTSMITTNYSIFIQMNGVCNNWANIVSSIDSKYTTYFKPIIRNIGTVNITNDNSISFNYYVFGE